jgi:protoheme IX farnesyltransferase
MKTRFRWLAAGTAVAVYALVVLGGVVRVTGSGLGCPDWPLCHGRLIPPLEGPALVEYSHRLASTLVTVLVLATAVVAWRRYRGQRWIVGPALLAVVLLGIQVVLGGITVLVELSPEVVALHLGNALLLFAAVLTATTFAFSPAPPASAASVGGKGGGATLIRRTDRFPQVALAAVAGTYVLLLSGALVTGSGAGPACPDWPLCNGQVLPGGGLAAIQMLHRFIVAAVSVLVVAAVVEAWRTRRQFRSVTAVAAIAAVFFAAQVLVGAANVLLLLPAWLRGLHLATATAVWGSLVVLTILAYRTAQPAAVLVQPDQGRGHSSRQPQAVRTSIMNYVYLTKPWIVLLLLTTTFGAMLVAQRGLPPLPLIFWTLLGGALAAGGAGALNSYIDRDLDAVMSRTSRRPLPERRIAPQGALAFGLILCIGSIFIFAVFVNWLSAILTAAGAIYYAGVYTCWLKRRTPHNIVIGGVAGAIPPLVGWAAVTNQVSLLALYLFAIIFYWTPPHTWALTLMVEKDYQRAGVPMLPVVRGEAETRRQILLYSLLLVAVSLIPFSAQTMGILYFATALVLGVWFLRLASKLIRDQSKSTARRLYRYSTYYLALLFLVMVIDRWWPL